MANTFTRIDTMAPRVKRIMTQPIVRDGMSYISIICYYLQIVNESLAHVAPSLTVFTFLLAEPDL